MVLTAIILVAVLCPKLLVKIGKLTLGAIGLLTVTWLLFACFALFVA